MKVSNRRSRIKELQEELACLREQEEARKRRKFIRCEKCNRKSRIDKITYIQTYWYVRPHG